MSANIEVQEIRESAKVERAARCCTAAPRVDVFSNDEAYLVAADLPGVAQGDAEVRLERGHLVIEGVHKLDGKETARYRRVLRVPDTIDAERVEARLSQGVLTLTLYKSDHARVRRIPIAVA